MKNSITLSIGSLFLGVVACSGSEGASGDVGKVTLALDPPTVVTGPAIQIGQTNARLGVTATDNGTSAMTECGVCWGPMDSGADYVTQTTGGVRCMRQVGCVNVAYYTNDGYMTQREYLPGATYLYKAYAINGDGIPTYGNPESFSVPKVNTGAATEIGQTQARLGVTVDNIASGAVTECGVCWGPSGTSIDFVTETTGGVRCMRQLGCVNAAYYTSDGYMAPNPYVPGTTYSYRGYAINDAGVAYGETKSFQVPQALQCIYYFTAYCSNGFYAQTHVCGTSLNDAYRRNLAAREWCVCGDPSPPPGCTVCCNFVSGGSSPN